MRSWREAAPMSSFRPPGGTPKLSRNCRPCWTPKDFRDACWTRPRPACPGASRGEEIAVWLARHVVRGCVIIDDHADMGELRSHLVQTRPAHGLQPSDVARAVALLRMPGPRLSF